MQTEAQLNQSITSATCLPTIISTSCELYALLNMPSVQEFTRPIQQYVNLIVLLEDKAL